MPLIKIRYHAYLREKLGRGEELVEVHAAQPRVRDVLDAFTAQHPECKALRGSLKAAIADEIVSENAVVRDGATVDLLPPYGGG